MNIQVFDRQIYLGVFTVPKPPDGKLISVYEQVQHDGNNGPIDIMYFQDLNYGIAITDKMVEYVKQRNLK